MKLTPNSLETENTLVETHLDSVSNYSENDQGQFFIGKGYNACYCINPWFQRGEKVLYTIFWRVLLKF